MKNILKNRKYDYKYIIIFLFFLFLNLLYFKKIYDKAYDNNFYILSIIVSIIEIILIVINKKMEEKEITIEKRFLFFGTIIGLIYLLVIPIGSTPDESIHFSRIYEISSGHITSKKNSKGEGGRELPTSIKKILEIDVENYKYTDLLYKLNQKYNSNEKFQVFTAASLYSPICYTPQVIGVILGRILHLPMTFIIYLARLANLACFLAILYLCIKYTPINKNLITLIAFLPMSMQSAISCQPDALTNVIAFALVTFVLYKINNKKRITKKEFCLMSILAIIMSQCKIVYIPICLILYLIPESCFKSKKDKYIKITALALFVIFINMIWLLISTSYLIEFREGVNTGLQLKYILTNPKDYIYILFNTINEYGMFYLYTSLGMGLERLNVPITQIYLSIYLVYIIYTLIIDNNGKELINPKEKILIHFIIISCILLIFTSLYLQWNVYKSDIILGVQGRYFIPLFLLIPLIVQTSKITIKKDNNTTKYSFLLIIMMNFYVIMTVIGYHI